MLVMMYMMYMMYSMIIDTQLMIPTTSTIDIMMIMVPYHSIDRSNKTRGIRRGCDGENDDDGTHSIIVSCYRTVSCVLIVLQCLVMNNYENANRLMIE